MFLYLYLKSNVDNNPNPNPQPTPVIQPNLLKINWNNEDIEAAHTKQDQSIIFPDPNYWTGDKLNRVEASNINLGYWTAVQNNFDNVKGEELIQNNEATAILYDAVIAQAKADSNGILELPSDDYSGMTNFNRRGKNYETSIKIDVSSLTGNFEIPNLNPQTTNITENGTYEIADSDNNPQDMEIERVDNRVLNLNKVKDGEKLRDGSISLGRFNVNVPILQRYSNLIKSTSSSYDDPTPEARDFVLIQNRTTPPENYKGVYETSNSTALISKTINSNGTYLIKEDDYYNDIGQNQGVIGWWKVNVSVPPVQVNPTIKRLRYDGDYYDIVPSEFTRIQGKQSVDNIEAGDLFILFTYDSDTAFWNPYVYHFATAPLGGGYPIGIEGNTITYYKKVQTNKTGSSFKPNLEYISYYDENRDDIISYDLDTYFADDDFSHLWTNLPAYGELPKSNIGDCIIVPFSRT